jgi:hypothetical protein
LHLSDLEKSASITALAQVSPASRRVDQAMNTTLHLEDMEQSSEPQGDVAGQVQNIVRQEMRRLMEVSCSMSIEQTLPHLNL